MLMFMLLPLVVGVLIRNRYPQLAMQIMPWLGPISVTFLVVHITLFIGYSWSEFLSIAGYGQMAVHARVSAGGFADRLLAEPAVRAQPASRRRILTGATKIVSMVAVAQQNTGAVICCAIFAFGKYVVAGDYLLLGAIMTIIVVMVFMAELGDSGLRKQQAVAAPALPALREPWQRRARSNRSDGRVTSRLRSGPEASRSAVGAVRGAGTGRAGRSLGRQQRVRSAR